MVGWRNYFDLKLAETSVHYVVVMENWRGREFELPVRKERCWECKRAGEELSEAASRHSF